MQALGASFPSAARRGALMVAVAAIAGLGIGFLLVPRVAEAEDPKQPPPEVRLLGAPLTLDDTAPRHALEALRRHVSGWFHLKVRGGEDERLSYGQLGVQIDKVRLAALVRDARDATSRLRRSWRQHGGSEGIELPVPLELDAERALPVLLALKDRYDRLPVDARLDFEQRQLVEERPGLLLDVDASLLAIREALGRGERSAAVVFEERRPKRTAAELGNVEFDAVLGFFETPYDRSEKAAARTYNLRLAASKLDGHVLLPGEVFDFNEVVGPRDEANGYKVAPVIAQGELVDGIGGGTCQISGTLHGAAFFAGLEIVERYPHTRPSSYIKMGLDATVVYPTINFRLKNPYEFPVVLHQTVKSGKVRAEILGARQPKTVTLIRRILKATPYEQIERPDPRLPSGVRVLSQRGVPGFELRTYRILREGEHALREKRTDVYPPTTQIVRVGRGDMPKDSVKARGDGTPEYVADELLVMTQGPDLDGAADGEGSDPMLVSREPGRYGSYGWTEKEGMPVWDAE